MVVTFMTTQQITALTIAGNTGQSIGGSQVALMAANSSLSFIYRLSNTTWYRTSAPALGNVGTAPVYAARAWVNFNGTGTVAIRASGNVSSITDNGTGDYTINFTAAMPDADYSFLGFAQDSATKMSIAGNPGGVAPTTTAFRVNTSSGNAGTSLLDSTYVLAAVFR
jgi:hypothetical protein